ncbi:hypothetical protein AK812_SmicGene21681 [Symbiodinium microadriaticum]|uniref:Uncharacterized protein n=1 Tax=Symbiodinium microadriaticum TaxID=2951 RepID=A0A1Q9DLR6_SYMMI|nr:hypothetical protein AK812_SmicGene21681 [Symbiodinium microadriaticum]
MKQVGSHGSQYGRRESGPSVSDQDWAEQEAGLDPSGPPVLRASVAGDAGRVSAPQRLQASARAVRNLFLCVCSKDDAADDERFRPSVEQSPLEDDDDGDGDEEEDDDDDEGDSRTAKAVETHRGIASNFGQTRGFARK